MTNATIDPMQAAMAAKQDPKERTYFGEVVTVDAWFAVLEKGVGKRPFDPQRDELTKRCTVIKIEVQPLKGDFLITQETVHFAAEWLSNTLPSLRKLNVDLNDIKGRFVQVKRVPSGATYTNRAGETKERTGLVFERVFTDGAECVQAAEAFFSQFADANANAPAAQTAQAEPAEQLSPEQDFALKSLPALWKASGNDPDKFKALIEGNPMISRYYPWDHIAVQLLIGNDEALPF